MTNTTKTNRYATIKGRPLATRLTMFAEWVADAEQALVEARCQFEHATTLRGERQTLLTKTANELQLFTDAKTGAPRTACNADERQTAMQYVQLHDQQFISFDAEMTDARRAFWEAEADLAAATAHFSAAKEIARLVTAEANMRAAVGA